MATAPTIDRFPFRPYELTESEPAHCRHERRGSFSIHQRFHVSMVFEPSTMILRTCLVDAHYQTSRLALEDESHISCITVNCICEHR
jgi:hypothetical protein